MQRIKIGMLTDNSGPMPRIYLKTLYDRGYEVDHIVMVKPFQGESRVKKCIVKAVPSWVLSGLLNLKQRAKGCFEQSKGLKTTEEKEKYKRIINAAVHLDSVLFENVPLRKYCPRIQYIFAEGMQDPRLIGQLKKECCKVQTYIYASSQLLKGAILRLGIHFLVCHPGRLPDFRGVNCSLWSLLYERRLGYSVIYVNEGVDTGDVLYFEERDVPRFNEAINDVLNFDYANFADFFQDFFNNQQKAVVMADAIEKILQNEYHYIGMPQAIGGRQFFEIHSKLKKHVGKLLIDR